MSDKILCFKDLPVGLTNRKSIDDYVDTYVNAGARDANAYTNIINGFGLFSLVRSASYPSITFERQTLDSLLYGRLTKHLKFKEW
jgi:hypothetical protein